MTVTDEIDIYRVMKRAGRKRADMAKAVAPLVQAAYAAGLERAAVIADLVAQAELGGTHGDYAKGIRWCRDRIADAIHAERDKT